MQYFTDYKTISHIQSHMNLTVTPEELEDKLYQDSYFTDKKTKVQISLCLVKSQLVNRARTQNPSSSQLLNNISYNFLTKSES